MTITFSLPQDIERLLAQEGRDLSLVTKEAALVELYRQEKISHGQLAQALGLSRYEADAVLKRHGVTEDLITREELNNQVQALEKLFDR
jgi:predicted HTH domain antitoxin